MRSEEVLRHNNEQERQALLSELNAAVRHSDWLPSDDITGRKRPVDVTIKDMVEQKKESKEGPEEFRSWLPKENEILLESFIDNYQARAAMSYYMEELENPEAAMEMAATIPTAREQQILHTIAMGLGNKEIASVLNISDQTVKNHVTSFLTRFDTPDRSAATLYAIEQGIVEPLLIDTTSDFSGYSELSSRERHLYKLFTTYGLSNAELGENMFITEQTVKNHMTSLLRKLGVGDRQETCIYEIKRLEAVLDGSKASLDLSPLENALLAFVASPESIKSAGYISQYGFPQLSNKPNLDIFKKVKAGNLYELTAIALLYEYGDIDAYIPPNKQSLVNELPDEQKSLLLELSEYFNDETPLSHRADLIGVRIDDIKKELKAIQGLGLSSPYQAIVFLQYSQLREAKKNLDKRKEHLEMLRGKQENPFVVPESQAADTVESHDFFFDPDDELW